MHSHIPLFNPLPIHEIPYLKPQQVLLMLVVVFFAMDTLPPILVIPVLNGRVHVSPSPYALVCLLIIYPVVPLPVLLSQVRLVILVEAPSV